MIKPEDLPSELDLKELVVRNSRGTHLRRAFVFGLPVLLCIYFYFLDDLYLVQSYESDEYAVLTFLVVLVFATLYQLYRIVRPATLAILDRKGVWLKKHGLINWDCIASYYSTVHHHRHGYDETFYIQLKDTDKVIKVYLSSANATAKTLKRYIYLFKGNNQILNYDEFDD